MKLLRFVGDCKFCFSKFIEQFIIICAVMRGYYVFAIFCTFMTFRFRKIQTAKFGLTITLKWIYVLEIDDIVYQCLLIFAVVYFYVFFSLCYYCLYHLLSFSFWKFWKWSYTQLSALKFAHQWNFENLTI